MSRESTYSRYWDRIKMNSQSFTHLNIYKHSSMAMSDLTLNESRPTTTNLNQRMGLWSKFRRSKGQNINHHHHKPSTIPQRAKSDSNLIWCPEQNIWLFARQPINHSSTPSSRERRLTSKTKHNSASILPPRAEYGEDELLFAQLPGHYCLGIYTEVNNEPISPCEPDFFDLSEEQAARRSRWMSVAERVGPRNTEG
ncbi:hypothetical protein FQN49_004867 [Arthroderma sp. PD_2]|nr:hypothetical protein FQN49_004867 [Arthroderma sp. PD_2]